MHNSTKKIGLDFYYLTGINQLYIEKLYRDFLIDSNSTDKSWHEIFKQISLGNGKYDQFQLKIQEQINYLNKDKICYANHTINDLRIYSKQTKILHLIDAFRVYGHHNANLDPLKLWKKEQIPDLDLDFYNFTGDDFQKSFNIKELAIGKDTMKLSDLYNVLKKIYCSNIGIEYMYITNNIEKLWIQQRIESVKGQPNFSYSEKIRFLDELTAAEGIEQYLGIKFPGTKRFSLEGGDVLIPMLKEIVRYAVKQGTKEIVISMAHRGRLNVLINVFGKKLQDIFDEFTGKHKKHLNNGDLKYHQGFSSYFETESGLVHLELAFNPSHLEIVNPVVMGLVRARIDRINQIKHDSIKILPINLHGDAAISGQGVVQETFNMSKVPGYEINGTVHVVINNQIGFTISNPQDIRSTKYCTDIAKMVQAPIFHVNADDPESVAFITHVALDFRNIFKRDVVIDLVCYRRHGHNEIDEPSATQPLMYKKIKEHPTSRKIYANRLERDGIITLAYANKQVKLFRDTLEHSKCVVKEWRQVNISSVTFLQDYLHHSQNKQYSINVKNKHLQKLACQISTVPDDIEMQPQVAKIYKNRSAMARGEKLFDWGGAEMLAYATLVDVGISIRLSGEDTARGTFFHRHAVVHNQRNGFVYTPLANIHKDQGNFFVWNSVLSEEAVLAFEYGYATAEPYTLVIWEAQFGDFANCAQVVIDQFISSGEKKWGTMCGLVMLLPHGLEGQGPEHSSARLERYLQLCAEHNMQVCIPSTPAQIYHMLRRQALNNIRKPLIVMSPKSLLRHPLATSSLDELSNGMFQSVINEIDDINPKDVKRVIMCSGKVYYDLLDQRRKNKQQNIAIIRIEQLYPFPLQAIREVLALYERAKDFVWCQEEPQNQGAWYYNHHYFRKLISTDITLIYIGRDPSAVSAEGYLSMHQIHQKNLINDALNIN